MSFVLDASVALAWIFEDEVSPRADVIRKRLETEIARVPWIWPVELINALMVAERRHRITAEKVNQQLEWIGYLAIEIDSLRPSNTHLCELCRRHQRTAYDALYLDLAMREKLPVATLDNGLIQACVEANVPVVID